MYNVQYETLQGPRLWLSQPVSFREATLWCRIFRAKYVGKRYPNARGFYDCRNAHVIKES